MYDKRIFSRYRGLGGSGWLVIKIGKIFFEVYSVSEIIEVVLFCKVDLLEVKYVRVCWYFWKMFEGY